MPTWMIYALLAAVCASLVSVLAKPGMRGVDPTVATAVRSVVMTGFLVAVVAGQGLLGGARGLSGKAMGFIAMSGVAGALSWLFMFKALALAEVSKVAPIDKLSMPLGIVLAVVLLGERPSGVNWLGVGMMGVGAYLATWSGK